MHFQSIWRPNFQKLYLWCPPLTKQTVKKLNFWEKTTADKSAWEKNLKGDHWYEMDWCISGQ